MNIVDGLEFAAQHRAAHPAIRFEAEVLTYAQLRVAVHNVARGFSEHGIKAGERVCLFLPNTTTFPICYYALMKLGAVAVSINALSKPDEVLHIVRDSAAVAIVTATEQFQNLPPSAEIPTVRTIFTEAITQGTIALSELIVRPFEPFPSHSVSTDSPAAILYTSGTTGKSKGAVLSHGNVLSNVHTTRHLVGVKPGDSAICFLPLFHCFGQNFVMNATLFSGATLILHRRFALSDVLDSVHTHQVTHFYAVPTVYITLLTDAQSVAPMRSVRYYFSAAAILPTDVERAWHRRTGLHIHEGYGLTETSPFASYNHAFTWREGSIGSPIDHVEMCVVDEHGMALSDGETGEICVRGPNVMLGYFNRPEDTARAITDGWFHSGDIGYRDSEGYYFIVDRVKDMINAAGFKVWPREVEEVIFAHPAVRECAVIGIPDDRTGEAVKAVVVLKQGQNATSEDIVEYCRIRLSNYKVPKLVEFVQTIPKGATGKILKKDLRT